MTVTARLKDFSENTRDSSSIGAGLDLSQQLGTSFRLREWYSYEILGARDASFSYTGHAAGVWATLKIARSWFFHTGYSLLSREYEEPAGATSRSQTTSLLLEHTLARKLYVFTAWDRQRYDDGGGVAPAIDTLYTIGIAYSL